jgi:hypothetical protein
MPHSLSVSSMSITPRFARQAASKPSNALTVAPAPTAALPRRSVFKSSLRLTSVAKSIAWCVAAMTTSSLLFVTPAQAKNTVGDCDYFANFLVTLSAMRDAGTPKAETVAYARKKATADHLGKSTVDLFAGEAIGMYYDKRQYGGTAQQVHDLAYKNCINSTLP